MVCGPGLAAQRIEPKGASRPSDDGLDGFAPPVRHRRGVGSQVDVEGGPGMTDRRRVQRGLGALGRLGAAVLIRQPAMPKNVGQPGRHPDVEALACVRVQGRVGAGQIPVVQIAAVLLILHGLGLGFRLGAGGQTGSPALLGGGAAVGIHFHPFFFGASRHACQPLPDIGGGHVKDITAGAGRQGHHDQVGRRASAQQQQRAAQQSAHRAAPKPGVDPVVVAGHPHLGHRHPLGRDVRKDHRRPAEEHQSQRQLAHAAQHGPVLRGEHRHIAHGGAQHKTARAKDPEQEIVHGVPGCLPVHKRQQQQQYPCKQGSAAGQQPAAHLLFGPGALAPGTGFSFPFCHSLPVPLLQKI